MNIYSNLKSAGVYYSCAPIAKRHRISPSGRGARRKKKEMEEVILIPAQPFVEKGTALQRPFEASRTSAEVYFVACRYSPFSFV